MIERRPFESLGGFENDWLTARHHFSFAEYVDPQRMNFGPLRVWNDDTIRAGRGFERHGHRDMEIVTYVRKGAITHQDHLGNVGRTEAGDVQVMSAGTGILHAEHNREPGETQIFQIWLIPDRFGVPPRWEQRRFPPAPVNDALVVLASGRPGDLERGALFLHQDAAILGATLRPGSRLSHPLEGRMAYLVPTRGRVRVGGVELAPRDGVAVSGEAALVVEALEDTEVVVADLPALR